MHYVKSQGFEGKTKTGLIVGMGESKEEVIAVLKDISKIDVDIVTIGQYLRPTAKHRPIDRYAPEEEFEHYKLCLLYTSPSPRDLSTSRMPSSA